MVLSVTPEPPAHLPIFEKYHRVYANPYVLHKYGYLQKALWLQSWLALYFFDRPEEDRSQATNGTFENPGPADSECRMNLHCKLRCSQKRTAIHSWTTWSMGQILCWDPSQHMTLWTSILASVYWCRFVGLSFHCRFSSKLSTSATWPWKKD